MVWRNGKVRKKEKRERNNRERESKRERAERERDRQTDRTDRQTEKECLRSKMHFMDLQYLYILLFSHFQYNM